VANIATAAAIAIGLPMWIRAVVGPPAPPADLDFRHVDIALHCRRRLSAPPIRDTTRRRGQRPAEDRLP
jgi:hypothetical protein